MAIRKLLTPIAETVAGEAALVTALMAAEIWRAHLTGLHVRNDSRDMAHMAGEGLSGAMIQDMMLATEREGSRRADAAGQLFGRLAEARGVPLGPAVTGAAGAEFVSQVGREDDRLAQLARLADLIVMPHANPAEDVTAAETLHAALFDSGRPVLISPPAAPASIGLRVCLAWSGTAESAAACRFALPWLQRAGSVMVLSSPAYQRRGPGAAELAGYLALHGIRAELAVFAPIERDVGAGLLGDVANRGADLLVMGAYSSSRLRQLILGGVTRHVLENATLPVLMSR